MTGSPSILVGIDGSDAARQALDWAVAHARSTGSSLRLVCVYALYVHLRGVRELVHDVQITNESLRVRAEEILEGAARQAEMAGVTATTEVARGDALRSLVTRSVGHSLVVVGAPKGLHSTVATRLPGRARCPVVVIPYRPDRSGTDEFRSPRRVVVGLDGSPGSTAALDHAAAYASVGDCELVAVEGLDGLDWDWSTKDRAMSPRVGEAVDRAALTHPGLRVTRCAQFSSGIGALVEASKGADLVVVGSRGRGRVSGLLLGSTSQALMHRAECPVLVVGPLAAAPAAHPGAAADRSGER